MFLSESNRARENSNGTQPISFSPTFCMSAHKSNRTQFQAEAPYLSHATCYDGYSLFTPITDVWCSVHLVKRQKLSDQNPNIILNYLLKPGPVCWVRAVAAFSLFLSQSIDLRFRKFVGNNFKMGIIHLVMR